MCGVDGDGLATKSYAIAAATKSEALEKFRKLDAVQLNATRWQVWGVTFTTTSSLRWEETCMPFASMKRRLKPLPSTSN